MAGKKGNATALFIIRGILVLLLNLIFYAIVVLGTIEVCKTGHLLFQRRMMP